MSALLTTPQQNSLIEYQVTTALSTIITIYPNVPVMIIVPDSLLLEKDHFLSPFLPELVEEGKRYGVTVEICPSCAYPHMTPVVFDRFLDYTCGSLHPSERTLFLSVITERGTEDLICAKTSLDHSMIREHWSDSLASIFRVAVHPHANKKVECQKILLTLA